jgi:hypothetical protein
MSINFDDKTDYEGLSAKRVYSEEKQQTDLLSNQAYERYLKNRESIVNLFQKKKILVDELLKWERDQCESSFSERKIVIEKDHDLAEIEEKRHFLSQQTRLEEKVIKGKISYEENHTQLHKFECTHLKKLKTIVNREIRILRKEEVNCQKTMNHLTAEADLANTSLLEQKEAAIEAIFEEYKIERIYIENRSDPTMERALRRAEDAQRLRTIAEANGFASIADREGPIR